MDVGLSELRTAVLGRPVNDNVRVGRNLRLRTGAVTLSLTSGFMVIKDGRRQRVIDQR